MRGIVGYVNHISSDSKFEIERLRNAALSLGATWRELRWGAWDYAISVKFPGDVIGELESAAFGEDEE